jgi:hypothetical protein
MGRAGKGNICVLFALADDAGRTVTEFSERPAVQSRESSPKKGGVRVKVKRNSEMWYGAVSIGEKCGTRFLASVLWPD